MESQIPFLIVGRGIAGTTLALTFWRNNIPFVVIDRGFEKSASLVAAGLYNPFTGPEMKLTWNAKALFESLSDFYPWAEELLNAKFFFPKTIYRPFLSVWEQNEILAKASENPAFVGEEPPLSALSETVNNTFGGLSTNQSGFVRTPVYLDAARQFFNQADCLIEEEFLQEKVEFNSTGITYKGKNYQGLIYANGVAAQEGPFEFVPFRPNKGEVLNITWDKSPSFIPNRKVYLVPLPEANAYKVGATYSNNFEHNQPTEQGKKELTDHLNNLIVGNWEVTNHLAGVRPAIADRKPVIGMHPEQPFTYIFGGLGAKGISLAPWCAFKLLNNLVNDEILPTEIHVLRFKKRYQLLKASTKSKVLAT
jgi:glycine/D-amino acid oxidase-like deaminating enzyme